MKRKTAYDPRYDQLCADVKELSGRVAAAEALLAAISSEMKAMSDLFVGMLRNFTDFALENEIARRATFAAEPMEPDGDGEAAVEP